MPMPGPFFHDQWRFIAETTKTDATGANARNSFSRVLAELGLVLAVPLAGALLVGMALDAFHVY